MVDGETTPNPTDKGERGQTVAIDNRQKHIKAFWFSVDLAGKVTSGGDSSGSMLRILPGLNDSIRKDVWDEVTKNKTWSAWIQAEQIVEVKRAPNKWPQEDAKALIERSADLGSMIRWRRAERRGELQKILDKKILDMRRVAVSKEDDGEPGFQIGDDA